MRVLGVLATATLWLALAVLCALTGLEPPGSAISAASANPSGAPDGKWVLVSIHQKRLTLYQGKKAIASYPVATGTAEHPTPTGVYRVSSRFASELSGFGTRFLGLNVPWGQYGVHGTNKPGSIGHNASHGCIRMSVPDAEALYAAVPNGARVVLEGGPYGLLDNALRPPNAGDRGGQVAAMQERLRALGYYSGAADGIFGIGTQRAVQSARKALGLPAGENADLALYRAIGLILFE